MTVVISRAFNLAGLLLNLVGVLILFYFGMPFHVPTGGAILLAADQLDPKIIALEHTYTILGYVGLTFLISGTMFQVVALFVSEDRLRGRFQRK
jgi:hypothetical protein